MMLPDDTLYRPPMVIDPPVNTYPDTVFRPGSLWLIFDPTNHIFTEMALLKPLDQRMVSTVVLNRVRVSCAHQTADSAESTPV